MTREEAKPDGRDVGRAEPELHDLSIHIESVAAPEASAEAEVASPAPRHIHRPQIPVPSQAKSRRSTTRGSSAAEGA